MAGLREERVWTVGTCRLLDNDLVFTSYDDVVTCHAQYEAQLNDVKRHEDIIKAKQNSCTQIEHIVGEERSEGVREQMGIVSERWDIIQERGESQKAVVRHVFSTWTKFQEAIERLTDISQKEVRKSYNVRVCIFLYCTRPGFRNIMPLFR